ncbi:MAG: Glycerol kinase [Anaerolineae bacterium]|nr:Glycerol kinase [Anaerolineae bacterium]
MTTFLLGIDQGSSGSRAAVMNQNGDILGYGYRPLPRIHPHNGWVEQDPHQLTLGVEQAITEALAAANCRPADILAVGIAGQRNTDFVWDARTGRPLANAITWQDLRTAPLLAELEQWEHAAERRRRLGYFPGTWSSANHLAWRMRHQPAVIEAARAGTLRIGFSANWLLESLGRPAGHMLDFGLVQQMGLFDFRAERYWSDWLAVLGVPLEPLPVPVPTVHYFGTLRLTGPAGDVADAPVLAVIGNEQAALFGHQCYYPGDAECSHGTASFVDVVVGDTPPEQEKLNVYYAWSFPAESPGRRGIGQPVGYPPPATRHPQHTFCLEADTTVSGAAIRWMKEEARLFDRDEELSLLAASVPDSGGVVFVPAFTGLNVPHNDAAARGTILGLTLGSSRAHLARAFLESLGYQIRGILETITAETGLVVQQISTGGGIAASDIACQIQADLTGIPTIRPAFTELAVRAAALLAGLGAGTWPGVEDLPALPGTPIVFEPRLPADQRDAGYTRWLAAVDRAKNWISY